MTLAPLKFSFPHRDLLGIEELSATDISNLLDLADTYVDLNRQVDKKNNISGKTIAAGKAGDFSLSRSLRWAGIYTFSCTFMYTISCVIPVMRIRVILTNRMMMMMMTTMMMMVIMMMMMTTTIHK